LSRHYSGPNLKFLDGDAGLDFTDLYAFPRPGDLKRSWREQCCLISALRRYAPSILADAAADASWLLSRTER
jgi:hypothetical protein